MGVFMGCMKEKWCHASPRKGGGGEGGGRLPSSWRIKGVVAQCRSPENSVRLISKGVEQKQNVHGCQNNGGANRPT